MYKNDKILLLALMGFAFINACMPNDSTTNNDPKNNDGKKTIQVYEWKQIKSMATNFKPTDNKVDHVANSKNGQWFYATANGGGELFAADLSAQFSDISDDSKWTKISLGSTLLDGSAGQATLEDAGFARALVPTEQGVLVERYAGGTNAHNGVGYLAGKAWTAAWSHKSKAHLVEAQSSATKGIVSPGLITKAGTEHPVLFSEYIAKDNFVGNTAPLGPVKMAHLVGPNIGGGNLFKNFNPVITRASPKLVMAGKDALILDSSGIHTLVESAIGDASKPIWKTQEDPATTDKTPYKGSNSWIFNKSLNNQVTAVAVSGSKLYIGLGTTLVPEPGTGGVAVYDFVTPADSKAPDKAWDGIAVLALTVDPAGTVWAVTKTKLIAAKPDGTMGDALTTKPTPTYAQAVDKGAYDKTPLLPTGNISDACFVGDNLVISTTDQGIIYRLAPVATTLSP